MGGKDRARPYRSELRRQQAAATRRRVVEAGVALFSQQGYRATTFAQLAEAAGVSVETVQKHGPKASLLQAAVELASFGVEGESDLFATDLGKSMLAMREKDDLASFVGEAVLAINAPSAGLWQAVVAAAQDDPDLREFRARMLGLVRGQVERFLTYVDERGWLRTDVPFDQLVESLCVINSVETYARYVLLDDRPPQEYAAFVARMVRETIFAEG